MYNRQPCEVIGHIVSDEGVKVELKKKGKKRKKETRTQILPGGKVNRLERAYSKGHFLFIRSDLQYHQIQIDALWYLLSGIQRLTTSL